jgi:hypothetical protein
LRRTLQAGRNDVDPLEDVQGGASDVSDRLYDHWRAHCWRQVSDVFKKRGADLHCVMEDQCARGLGK